MEFLLEKKYIVKHQKITANEKKKKKNPDISS